MSNQIVLKKDIYEIYCDHHFVALSSLSIKASHLSDASSIILEQKEDQSWVLKIRAPLSVYQKEIKSYNQENSYETLAEFKGIIVSHLMKNISIETLSNKKIYLGEEEMYLGERVFCGSGENFRIEAKQDHYDLGLDTNNAHVQPTGEYHYHGISTEVVSEYDDGEDLIHIGFANDDFLVYYTKTGVYKPSYTLIDATREGTDCSYTQPHTSQKV